jgi:prepilin-type N-terminal cleavage/methylation domain-containing protein
MTQTRSPSRGYTLFELLIVLMTLGILSAIVLPRLDDFRGGGRDVTLASELSLIRNAIEHYKVTHEGSHPDSDPAAQLTRRTDGIGPFMSAPFPTNPVNGLATIAVLDRLPPEADGTSGWIYVRSTGMLRANLPGLASNGLRYLDL